MQIYYVRNWSLQWESLKKDEQVKVTNNKDIFKYNKIKMMDKKDNQIWKKCDLKKI